MTVDFYRLENIEMRLNAQVSKSEGSDVGALENASGNKLATDFGLSIDNLSSIGYFSR